MASSSFSPKKPRKENMFDFDDDLESKILANEYQDSSAKGFLTSNIGKQMLDSFLTVEEDDATVKIGAPLYYPEELTENVGKVEISDSKASNFSVKFTSSPERSDSDSIESISKPQTQTEPSTSVTQPEDVIRDLFLGKHTWIGQFRKLSEKHELLQLALKTHDQNTIYSILSHLRLTLNPTVLFETLNQFPKSKIHYFTYLKEKGHEQELINATHACKDFEKCGILKLRQARKITDPYKQALVLKECIDYLKKTGLEELAELALDESELLESQLSIHAHEKSVGMSGIGSIEIFSPVLRTPNYTTLYYLCLRHFDSTAGGSCPANFQTRFNLTNKEFLWIALSARAQLKDWQGVDSLLKQFQAKSFFGLGKLNTPVIPPEDILEILYGKDPTAWGEKANELRDSLIVSLLNQTEDLEVRCSLSLDYLCHPVVIETLVKLKDKTRLEDYVTKVPAFSKYRKLIGDKLASKSIAWKNV